MALGRAGWLRATSSRPSGLALHLGSIITRCQRVSFQAVLTDQAKPRCTAGDFKHPAGHLPSNNRPEVRVRAFPQSKTGLANSR